MQSLFRSFFTVSFYTLLSRILGFVRDILIARFLGSTVTSDAFFVAFRIPNFFRRVLAEGAYSAALVPVFSGIVINSKDDHEVAVELKSFDMLQLYGSCEENSQRTTNSMLQGVFLMWILLTVIMVVSGILAWKKQQDLNRNSFDEES